MQSNVQGMLFETVPHIPSNMNASKRRTEISASARNDTAFDIIIDRVPCSVL